MHDVNFRSNNVEMQKGFEWAKEQALFYAHDDAIGGPCYEAALPRRRSFCMRDVSHQAVGGHYLGLQPHNRNMMRHFAEAINESRDYCSYWEITFDGDPTPVDYTDDSDFWYNLPANFDVMASCYELYELTGDESYLTSKEMVNFFELSMNEYLKKWDRDGDGIVDRVDSDGRRGIASYDEGYCDGYKCAGDAVACEIAGFRAGAVMYKLLGKADKATEAQAFADKLAKEYDEKWWIPGENRFAAFTMKDGSLYNYFSGCTSTMSVHRHAIIDPEKLKLQLGWIADQESGQIVEERSYLPKVFWQNDMDDIARMTYLKMTAPEYQRREYPEVSYSAADALITGFMGVVPEYSSSTLRTANKTAEAEWAELTDLPVWDGTIDVKHENGKSTLVNKTGKTLKWINKNSGTEKCVTVAPGETAVL